MNRDRIDTGKVVIEIPVIRSWPNAICYPPFVASLSYKDMQGRPHPILRGAPHTGLRVAEADGRVFLSERTLNPDRLMNEPLRRRTREVTVVERGPVRAWVQIRGISACDIYSPGLDYVIGIEACRNSSLVKFEVTWRHADNEIYRLVRDLRFALPFADRCRRVTTGMEHGATTEDLMPGSAYRVLQEDEDVYYADRLDPNGERVGLAWGSGHGRKAPGWMQARFEDARLSVAVRDFVREYPNEIRVTEDEVSVGLWPRDKEWCDPSPRPPPPRGEGEQACQNDKRRAVPTFKQGVREGTVGYERNAVARGGGGRGSDYHGTEITQPERSTARQARPALEDDSFMPLFF